MISRDQLRTALDYTIEHAIPDHPREVREKYDRDTFIDSFIEELCEHIGIANNKWSSTKFKGDDIFEFAHFICYPNELTLLKKRIDHINSLE